MSRALSVIVGCMLLASAAAVSTHASDSPSASTEVTQHAAHQGPGQTAPWQRTFEK
jgi:hypothetical protein